MLTPKNIEIWDIAIFGIYVSTYTQIMKNMIVK